MSSQTDILASVPVTATGQVTDQAASNLGRTRVKALYIVPAAGAGSIVLKDGGAGGNTIATFNTVASATAPTMLLLPGEGLLFRTNVHATVSSIGSVTVFYG